MARMFRLTIAIVLTCITVGCMQNASQKITANRNFFHSTRPFIYSEFTKPMKFLPEFNGNKPINSNDVNWISSKESKKQYFFAYGPDGTVEECVIFSFKALEDKWYYYPIDTSFPGNLKYQPITIDGHSYHSFVTVTSSFPKNQYLNDMLYKHLNTKMKGDYISLYCVRKIYENQLLSITYCKRLPEKLQKQQWTQNSLSPDQTAMVESMSSDMFKLMKFNDEASAPVPVPQ